MSSSTRWRRPSSRIFKRFTQDFISSVVRWWEGHKDDYPHITKTHIHHQHVRRILANEKYIGIWEYGKTITVRNSAGDNKQVKPLPYQKVTKVASPDLRGAVGQGAAALAQFKGVYGLKSQGKKRRPVEHYRPFN
ncbi:MAG TPA: recombinase family protein [Tepidisphaeraceae bacterium]|nr:recombinase family protein [Tepidisphaeraceae bacterium]